MFLSVEKIQKVKIQTLQGGQKTKKVIFLSKCAVCDCKNLIFIKEQEANALLTSLRIKIPLSKIPLVDLLLF